MKSILSLLLGALAFSHAQSSPPDSAPPPATPAMVLEEIRELKAQQQRLEEQLQQNQQTNNTQGLPANVQLQVVPAVKTDSGVVIEWFGEDDTPVDSAPGLLGLGSKFPGMNPAIQKSKADRSFSSSASATSLADQGLLVGWGLLLDPNTEVGMGALTLGYYSKGIVPDFKQYAWTAFYLTYGDFLFQEGGEGGSIIKLTAETGAMWGSTLGVGFLGELGLTQTSDWEGDRNGVVGAGLWMQIWKFQVKCILDIPDYLIPDSAPLIEVGMRLDI